MSAAAACLNCGNPLAAGPFCPSCGQQQPHRLSVAHVAHEVLHVFTHADKSIFRYAGQVLLHPGRLVADYLLGRRRRYFNPFQFLLLAVGAATLLATQLHYYHEVGASVQQAVQARGATPAHLARVATYFNFIGTYFNVWWLLLLPFHALFGWLAYRRRCNYAEAFLLLVVVGSAFQLYLLLALPAVFLLTGHAPGNGMALLQGGIYLVYFTLVGHYGLGTPWGGAAGRALIITVLAALFNFSANYLAFRWYVFG